MPLFGKDIKVLDTLKNPLSQISGQRRGALETELGRIGSRATASADASGRTRGSYIPAELGRASQMAGAGIDNTLLGVIGGASKKDAYSARDYMQNMQLAKMIGKLNKPSVLQEVLGGLGDIAGTGSQLYGAFKGKFGTGGNRAIQGPELPFYDPNEGYF